MTALISTARLPFAFFPQPLRQLANDGTHLLLMCFARFIAHPLTRSQVQQAHPLERSPIPLL